MQITIIVYVRAKGVLKHLKHSAAVFSLKHGRAVPCRATDHKMGGLKSLLGPASYSSAFGIALLKCALQVAIQTASSAPTY